MRSRTPIAAAIGIALLALIVAFWSTRRDDQGADGPGRPLQGPPAGGIALLKDRPLPRRQPLSSKERSSEEGSPPANPPGASGTPGAQTEAQKLAARRRLARADAAARKTAVAGAQGQARATEQDVAVDEDEAPGPGGVPENPVPTFEPESIYEGLSQDDLVELMVALRRLRDAGVFYRLTPEQYYNVQELLGDRQGVQDADRITQEILGMGVGEWLAHERGPKGRFILQ